MNELWKPELPGFGVVAWLAPCLALWIWGSGLLAGWLKLNRGARTADTRKLIHFSVFSLAALLKGTMGTSAVNLAGLLAAVYIAFCLWRGSGSLFFEAMARESDRPRRSLHILIPFLATAAGGITAISAFGNFAVFGFAICGLADAVAEPIGVRLGKRRYRTWNLPGCGDSYRSIEGSLAVFVASFIAAAIVQYTALTPLQPVSFSDSLLPAAAIAAVAALIEAISPHGTDNFTLQVGISGFAWGWESLLPLT